MTSYRFRAWLLPNPPLEFEPETEVWRDIEADGSYTLTDFHETIFDPFERWDTHAYEFLLRDKHGIAIRSYAHPEMYSGGQSWPPMNDAEIDRFLDHTIPDDAPEEARGPTSPVPSVTSSRKGARLWLDLGVGSP